MHIVHHAHLSGRQLDGVHRLQVADRACGFSAFDVALIDLDPGAQLPDGEHAGERLVLVLAGQGKLLLPGGPQRFAAPCSLFIPPHTPYQIVNSASTPLQLVVVSSAA